MRKPLARAAALVVAFSVAAVIVWTFTYPEPDYGMDLDTASHTMIGDANREMLVLGKTKVELRGKFGYLSTLSEASPYLRGCYENSDWKGTDVLFIRKSPWMIVFSGDKATNLVLIKGC